MHERFSDRARHAMALANQEAGKLRHGYLAPAHIMLGLIAEGHCVATEALRVLDVNLDKVREQVAEQLGQGDSAGGVGLRAQTDATKAIISAAVEEARKLGHRYVGTEHLVLALLQAEESIPAKVLRAEGVEAGKLREQVLAMLRSSVDAHHDLAHSRHGEFQWLHQQELAKAFRSPKFWHTLVLAVDTANRLGAGEIEPEHLLMAILRDETSSAANLLKDQGVTADWLRAQLAGGAALV
jgi:ATP-dependent Clp protease ATP-binding subunit ClpA